MESVEIVFSDIIWSSDGSVVLVVVVVVVVVAAVVVVVVVVVVWHVYNLQQLCEAFKVGIRYALIIRCVFFLQSVHCTDLTMMYCTCIFVSSIIFLLSGMNIVLVRCWWCLEWRRHKAVGRHRLQIGNSHSQILCDIFLCFWVWSPHFSSVNNVQYKY